MSTHRLVIPVPEGGWLTKLRPSDSRLYDAWIEATLDSATAVGLPAYRRVQVSAEVRSAAGRRIEVAADVRPSLDAVLAGLVAAEVIRRTECAVGKTLTLGVPTGDLGALLVLRLTEVG